MSDTDRLDALRTHLRTAMTIEWSTIPPYLCALWSIRPGTNEAAVECLRDVVMEEMLHLTLVSNVLSALEGEPQLLADPVSYPTFLPHSDDSFLVPLQRFSPAAIDVFLQIERPAPSGAARQSDRFHTIGQFYEAVTAEIKALMPPGRPWPGSPAAQVGPERLYYGGGGDGVVVRDTESALKAIAIVMDEGEGIDHTIFDGDQENLGERKELAHFFRFAELARGRRYLDTDTPKDGPTGPPILLDFDAVLPMRANPKASDHGPGTELRAMAHACNVTYSRLLVQLQEAFGGRPDLLVDAVHTMYELKDQAIGLMHVPLDDGQTAGPPFEWVGLQSAGRQA